MTGASEFLSYPRRREGMDHGRYRHRLIGDVAPFRWPDGTDVAVWITVHVQHFPFGMGRQPFVPTGGNERPYPSLWDYTLRDYGNRVGIYRIMRELAARRIDATFAVNSALAALYPGLLDAICDGGWEIAAAGVDMGKLHHGGLEATAEEALVVEAFSTLRAASPRPVVGWHSPAHSESFRTPDLVAGQGALYIADWLNDDLPYAMNVEGGSLVSLPLSLELSDMKLLAQQNHGGEEYCQQILDAAGFLRRQAGSGGTQILSLALTPWVIGQPARIQTLRRLLDELLAMPGVSTACGETIARHWLAAHPENGVS